MMNNNGNKVNITNFTNDKNNDYYLNDVSDPLFSGIDGVSSVFSSTVSKTEEVGVKSPLEIIVNPKLQIINKVATIAVAFVIKLPAVLENIKFSCETPIPSAPPSDFCIKTNKTKIIANTMFKTNNIFSMGLKYMFF